MDCRPLHISTWLSVCVLAAACAEGVAATGHQNTSHPFALDRCGPADPAYIRTANETGGIPLFLQRNETAKAMQLMRESIRKNVSTELWASSKLAIVNQVFNVPVDSRTERITFTFSVDTKGTALVLKQPNGAVVTERTQGIEDTELNCGRIITVERPQPGKWRAEVSGSGTFWLQAQVQSDIYFIKAEFVEVRGRLGHEGLFRIQGQPLAGKPATLQISLSADEAKTTEFAFVSSRGDLLQKLSLRNPDPNREFLDFAGEVRLPDVPFRVAAIGYDMNGMPYQRFYGPLFHAETLEVVPKFQFDEIAPGQTLHAAFEIRNHGAAGAFRITATDAQRFVTRVEPSELILEKGASGLVTMEICIPQQQGRLGEDDLVVVASSLNPGSPTSNSAVVRLSVRAAESVH